jgi:hypothetical protein
VALKQAEGGDCLMNWIELVAYGISGALGALLAYPILARNKERRAIYAVVAIAAMYVVHALAAAIVLPRVYDWQTDRELRGIRFYSELADSSPADYQKVKDIIRDGVMKGQSARAMTSRATSVVAGILPKYVPTASDESVNQFVQVTTHMLGTMNQTSPDACYQFLFPQKFTVAVASPEDEADKNALLDAMADVLHSATHNPQPPPDKTESAALLQPVAGSLANKYGRDVALLQTTAHDSAERAKVCTIAIDLYSQILALPPRQSSELLRYLLSAQ